MTRYIPDPCPRCGHATHPTAAIGRFTPGGPSGYVDAGDPHVLILRARREEAEADACRRQQEARR